MRGGIVSICLLAFSFVAAPAAAAEDAPQDVCVSPGNPPDEAPRLQVEDCGPDAPTVRVVLRLITPTGTQEREVGTCAEDCDVTIVVEVRACRALRSVGPDVFAEWDMVDVLDDESFRDPSSPADVDTMEGARECESYVRKTLDLT